MVQDCPQCKLVNPPSATHCDCGYDFHSRQVDYSRAPKGGQSPGAAESVWIGYRAAGGIMCVLAGFGVMVMSLGGPHPFVGIAFGLAFMGAGVAQVVFWLRRANQ